jgi:hypothetical protein
MTTPDVREKLIKTIDELTDEQVEVLQSYADVLRATELPDDYNEENDPSIGFISGPTDIAAHVKQILHEEISQLSGWTQKKD